jgi:hypothetical protein
MTQAGFVNRILANERDAVRNDNLLGVTAKKAPAGGGSTAVHNCEHCHREQRTHCLFDKLDSVLVQYIERPKMTDCPLIPSCYFFLCSNLVAILSQVLKLPSSLAFYCSTGSGVIFIHDRPLAATVSTV